MKTHKIIIIILFIFIILINKIPGQENTEKITLPKNTFFIEEPVFNSRVYLYESGKNFKTSIILVHGVGDDASDIWKNLIPLLEKQYHVICFDLPGFGRSEKANELYSPKNYAAFIKWVYDKYVEDPMCLVGHSMGGAISLYYAGAYPESLQRLILIDAAAILHRTTLTKNMAKARLSKYNKYNLFNEQFELIDELIESTINIEGNFEILKDVSLVLTNSFLRRKLLGNPKKIAGAAVINENFSTIIEKVKSPVFMIWGEADPIAPLRTGKMLSYMIPNSKLNIMKGLGHDPMIEDANNFNHLIIKCLSEEIKSTGTSTHLSEKKILNLSGKKNITLEGFYDSISLNNCSNIHLKNIFASGITIKNSSVELENISVKSESIGIKAINSEIIITGGNIEAKVGLYISNCKADIAGVRITGQKSAVETSSNTESNIIFSVSKIKSPYNDRYIHELLKIEGNNSF